jgi:hypothetical protein
VPAGLVIWASAVLVIFCSPETAAHWTREFGTASTGHATRDRIALVLLAGVLAMFCSIPFVAIGRLFGFFVARRLLSEPPPEVPASDLGSRQFLSQLATPAGREQTLSTATALRSNPTTGAYGVSIPPVPAQPPQMDGGRSFIARAFFTLLWAVVFFVGGALVMAAVVTAGITDPKLRDQASRHAGQTWGLWLFLGSIGLAILLGSRGVLPGTRRKRPAS